MQLNYNCCFKKNKKEADRKVTKKIEKKRGNHDDLKETNK